MIYRWRQSNPKFESSKQIFPLQLKFNGQWSMMMMIHDAAISTKLILISIKEKDIFIHRFIDVKSENYVDEYSNFFTLRQNFIKV